ncbi:MAG TPA: MATE family efflux transporter [Acidimicrobiales bacterium]|nr:MATE family efflux transporter [Acidimicrobiales bacterium]
MTSDAERAVDGRLLALAVPAVFTLAAEPLYVLADTAIVGHIGTTALGGLGLAAIVLTTSAGMCNVLTWWTTSRVGFLHGARDEASIRRVTSTVLWLSLALGATIAALVVGAAPAVVHVLGGSGTVHEAAVTYLRIGALGLPALLLAWAGMGVARGEGDTRSPMVVIVGANALNLLLEVWFVYRLDWGIAGSAWGTVAAQWTSAAVFTTRLIRRTHGELRPDLRELRTIGRVSVDLTIRTGALFAALALASAVAARIGAVALAAHQVLSQLNMFIALVLDAAAIAAQALIAEAQGAGDTERLRLVIRRAARLTLYGAIGLAALLLGGMRVIPGAFTDDQSVVDAVAAVMPILALMQFPAAAAYLLDGVLMGESKFVTVRRSTLSGLVAFALPAALVLARPSLGLHTVWLGLVGWVLARALVNATGLRTKRATLVT